MAAVDFSQLGCDVGAIANSLVFPTTFEELVRITSGTPAEVGE
jgi:hypothetical protein